MIPPLDAAELLRALDAAEVDHVVIGAFAVIGHGVVRATRDLDIVPAPERANLQRLAALLSRLGATHIGADELGAGEFPYDPTSADDLAQGGNFVLATAHGRLDVLQWVPGIEGEQAYESLAADAVQADAFGATVRVASLTKLRAMKRAAARPQDLRDLEDLAIAHGEG